MATSWIVDPKSESILRSLNIEFKIAKLNLSNIDWKATEENAGRIGRKLHPDRIDDYAKWMAFGDSFPMPIAVQVESKVQILAGVHRCKAAMQLDEDTIQAYWANVKLPHEARLIACLTNIKEGMAATREEAIEQALYIISQHGLKTADVAKIFQINVTTLNDRIRGDKIRMELAEAGFKKKLPRSTFNDLNGIKGNIKVLVAACDYLSGVSNPTVEAAPIVKEVQKLKTEAQQIAYLEQKTEANRKTHEVAAAAPVKLAVRTRFLRALHGLDTTIGDCTLEQLQIVPQSDDHKLLKKEWNIIRGKINRIIG